MTKQNLIKDRQIVVVNQASNYLTVGLCNAFAKKIKTVNLVTGSIHVQGEELAPSIGIMEINQWVEKPPRKKILSYLKACFLIYWSLLVHYRKHEVLFVSLPPMAYLLSIILPHRCSMLIWDVYPDVFKITGLKETHILYRSWSWLNKKAFKKAFRLYTIGDRMAKLLEKYVPRDKILVTPIWSIFQENSRVPKENNIFLHKHGLHNKFIVQYSGNIGLTHNVEVMIELADMLKNNEEILFQIIGRGPRVVHLMTLVAERNLPNCQFLPFQSDEMFPHSLSAADIGVVILDELTSRGSVPSKSYNLMSYGIPSLYVAAKNSELSDYAAKYRHAECVDHNNLEEAVKFILKLCVSKNEYNHYSENAVKASVNYRKSNADKIVELYLQDCDAIKKVTSVKRYEVAEDLAEN